MVVVVMVVVLLLLVLVLLLLLLLLLLPRCFPLLPFEVCVCPCVFVVEQRLLQ